MQSERSDPEKALEGDHGLGFEPKHPELSQASQTPSAQTASERRLQAQGHGLSPRDHLKSVEIGRILPKIESRSQGLNAPMLTVTEKGFY